MPPTLPPSHLVQSSSRNNLFTLSWTKPYKDQELTHLMEFPCKDWLSLPVEYLLASQNSRHQNPHCQTSLSQGSPEDVQWWKIKCVWLLGQVENWKKATRKSKQNAKQRFLEFLVPNLGMASAGRNEMAKQQISFSSFPTTQEDIAISLLFNIRLCSWRSLWVVAILSSVISGFPRIYFIYCHALGRQWWRIAVPETKSWKLEHGEGLNESVYMKLCSHRYFLTFFTILVTLLWHDSFWVPWIKSLTKLFISWRTVWKINNYLTRILW